jgi:hypothetical protein
MSRQPMGAIGAAADEKQYMESLYVAGDTPTPHNSVRLQLYFDTLARTLAKALAASQAGELEKAFVLFLKYMNIGLGIRKHNSYTQKVYERDRRKLEREQPKVMAAMEVHLPSYGVHAGWLAPYFVSGSRR